VVSKNVSVVTKSIPIVSIPSPDLVSILKCVPSNSKNSHSNARPPVEVVSDSSGCSIKVDNKGVKNRKTHRHTYKNVILTSPSSANEGVTFETVDKSFQVKLKKSKDKNKTDYSDESDSESEPVTI